MYIKNIKRFHTCRNHSDDLSTSNRPTIISLNVSVDTHEMNKKTDSLCEKM